MDTTDPDGIIGYIFNKFTEKTPGKIFESRCIRPRLWWWSIERRIVDSIRSDIPLCTNVGLAEAVRSFLLRFVPWKDDRRSFSHCTVSFETIHPSTVATAESRLYPPGRFQFLADIQKALALLLTFAHREALSFCFSPAVARSWHRVTGFISTEKMPSLSRRFNSS